MQDWNFVMLKRVEYQNEVERTEQFHVFTMADAYRSPLMRQFFQLRKKVFIDQMGWDLPVCDLGEVDQYDREGAFYLVSEFDGHVTGGLRLTPTTTEFETEDGVTQSYMIRDAQAGRLANMPTDLISCEAPIDPKIWEVTRVITSKEPLQLKKMFAHMSDFLRTQGATHFLFHTRPAAGRLGKIWHYKVEKMGPVVPIGGVAFQVHKVGVK